MVLHPVATSVFFALTSVLTQSSSSTVGLLLVSVHAVASVGVLLAWVMVSWLDPSEEAPDPAPCLKVSQDNVSTRLLFLLRIVFCRLIHYKLLHSRLQKNGIQEKESLAIFLVVC